MQYNALTGVRRHNRGNSRRSSKTHIHRSRASEKASCKVHQYSGFKKLFPQKSYVEQFKHTPKPTVLFQPIVYKICHFRCPGWLINCLLIKGDFLRRSKKKFDVTVT
jgi:hypothetical protein